MGVAEQRYAYDESYKEVVQLSDGERVHLRTMLPSDKQILLDGFELLSTDSRYARFMTSKSRLSDSELRYLTEVDGVDHFAMGAIRKHLVSKPEGVGSARFVRLNDEPDAAELAVTVVDGYHGKGLGGMLLQRLIEAAWERDVRWFRAELLADNVASRRMIESLSPDVQFRNAGDDAVSATLPVPEPDQTPTAPGFLEGTPIRKLFSYVAQTKISVRTRVTQPPEPPP